jgi:hypothetical protein
MGDRLVGMQGGTDGMVDDVASAGAEHEIIVITVYEPDPAQWEPGFEERKP